MRTAFGRLLISGTKLGINVSRSDLASLGRSEEAVFTTLTLAGHARQRPFVGE